MPNAIVGPAGILAVLVGNLVALAQSNVRRLLAYSAVAHAGYTLLGLVAGGREGFGATLFYTTVYAFTLVGTFSVVALVRRETGGWKWPVIQFSYMTALAYIGALAANQLIH